MKRKMLILTNRQLHNGPRMITEFETFSTDFDITAFGKTPPSNEQITYINIAAYLPVFYKIVNAVFRRLYFKKLTTHIAEEYPKIEKYILQSKFDVIIIHDPVFLPLICRLKKKIKFLSVYNAHEYHPLEFDEIENWTQTEGRYAHSVYKNYLKGIDLLINVCNGIAAECEKEFQIKSLVIPNVAARSEIKPVYNSGTIKLIYHGVIMKSRNIESMIDMMKILGPDYTLDIMGVAGPGGEAYFTDLKEYAKQTGNVFFTEPVPFSKIIEVISNYDIGLYILRPNNFNNTYSLPNKLFEFIQAKLAIAIAPSVEMKYIVEKYDLGVVGDDFSPESLAEKVKLLTREDIKRYKLNAVSASAIENTASYSKIYLQKVKSMLS